jgi:hypothetical protein
VRCILHAQRTDINCVIYNVLLFVQNVKAYLRRGTARESLLRYKEAADGKNPDCTLSKCSSCM